MVHTLSWIMHQHATDRSVSQGMLAIAVTLPFVHESSNRILRCSNSSREALPCRVATSFHLLFLRAASKTFLSEAFPRQVRLIPGVSTDNH